MKKIMDSRPRRDEAFVVECRKRIAVGELQKEIAKALGVSQPTVSRALREGMHKRNDRYLQGKKK
jgi:predicted XRE-type DNA-binding protein